MKFGIDKNPSDVLKDLASRHKAIRRQKGLSQLDLSQRSGVSLGSLKRFESTGQISLVSLLKLMQLLDRLGEFDSVLLPVDNFDAIEKLFSDKTRK